MARPEGIEMLRIELLIDAHASLGEGPLWDVREQRLYWIDSLGAKVHSCDASGDAQRTWNVPEHIGSLALRESGGAVVSFATGSTRSAFRLAPAASSLTQTRASRGFA
jgi:sugar lactone lactonase YvrE